MSSHKVFLSKLAAIQHILVQTQEQYVNDSGEFFVNGAVFNWTADASGGLALVCSAISNGRKEHLKSWYEDLRPYGDYGRMTREVRKYGSFKLVQEALAKLNLPLFLHTYKDKIVGVTQSWTSLHESSLFAEWPIQENDMPFFDQVSKTWGIIRELDSTGYIRFISGYDGRKSASMSVNLRMEVTMTKHGKQIRELINLEKVVSKRKHLSRIPEVLAAWDELNELGPGALLELKKLAPQVETICASLTPTKARTEIAKLIRALE